MSSFSLTLRLLLLCIVCAQGAAEESSGVAEPECQCLHAYAAGPPDSVHVHVFMHDAHVQEETIVNLAGLDEITADNDVNDTEISYSCNLTYTTGWDRLPEEPTYGLLQELLRRANTNSQESAYNLVMTLLEWIQFLLGDVLPQLLALLLNLCVRLLIVYSVMKHRETAREYQERILRG